MKCRMMTFIYLNYKWFLIKCKRDNSYCKLGINIFETLSRMYTI